MAVFERKTFLTNDGITLSYLEGGEGPGKKPLVLLHGWSQSANTFKFILDALGERYHVYVPDQRGHGESEKPAFGYRIARLAKDFDDFLAALNLKNIYVLGHSMSCAVLWCYIDLFGQKNFSKLILNDQRVATLRDSEWTARRADDMGACVPPDALYQMGHALRGADSRTVREKRLKDMTGKTMSSGIFGWLLEENLKMPREYAARLLYNNWVNDWSDLIPRITVPTLIIGGKASVVSWETLLWQNKMIIGSKLEIFEEDEGGSHFIFVENPGKFARIVCDFLG
jgi:pimeloyl-ACP methyl ester carboxylesterase